MAAPLGIGDIKILIDQAVKLYDKFQAAHEQIHKMADEMKHLKPYLSQLEALVQSNNSILRDAPEETRQLKRNLKEIQSATSDVVDLFKEWGKDQSFLGRVGWALLSSNPDKLRSLSDLMSLRREFIRDWIILANTRMLGALQAGTAVQAVDQALSQKPAVGKVKPKDILFLDRFDTDLAVVAAAYTQLLRGWAERNGKDWPLNRIHSAGTRVQGEGAVAAAQRSMDISTMSSGGGPLLVALDSLFDNAMFKNVDKSRLLERTRKHRAKSLYDNYARYDYIVVFGGPVRREFGGIAAYMEREHKAIPLKGRLIRLANYHPDTNVKSITAPKQSLGSAKARSEWNMTTAQIKLAVKEFLEQELGFERPKSDTR